MSGMCYAIVFPFTCKVGGEVQRGAWRDFEFLKWRKSSLNSWTVYYSGNSSSCSWGLGEEGGILVISFFMYCTFQTVYSMYYTSYVCLSSEKNRIKPWKQYWKTMKLLLCVSHSHYCIFSNCYFLLYRHIFLLLSDSLIALYQLWGRGLISPNLFNIGNYQFKTHTHV